MEKKEKYSGAVIEIAYCDPEDIIMTSGALDESNDPYAGWDSDGWT